MRPTFLLFLLFFTWFIHQSKSQSWDQLIKLTASDRAAGDQFGSSVAISDNYAIVGATREDEDVSGANTLANAGAAYIFEIDGNGTWIQKQKIVPNSRSADDLFGSSVAISGNQVFICATNKNNYMGAVFVFERDINGIWIQKQVITPPDFTSQDNFGSSIAASENFAIIGSRFNQTNAAIVNSIQGAGAAYIYERNSSGIWIKKQKITASDRNRLDNFGYSVSLDGNYAIIAAVGEGDDTTPNQAKGAAYVFEQDASGNWVEKQKLIGSERIAGDNFGISVSLNGNTIIIGSSGEDINGTNTGSAYIFERSSNGVWVQQQKLAASESYSNYGIGSSVSLYDTYAIVGVNAPGSAYIFAKEANNTWVEKQKLISSDLVSDDYFGRYVAIHEKYVIISASYEDHDATGANSLSNAGSVYIFKNCSTPTPTGNTSQNFCQTGTINSLTATGTAIKWYDAAANGNLLSTNTALINGTKYYASQTIDGCESSERMEVTVTINTSSAPTGPATQNFCNEGKISDLTVTGNGIKWYDATVNGTDLNSTTILSNNSKYYASQTIDNCESINRLEVTATIHSPSAPTGTATQKFCSEGSISGLTVTGNTIKWYDADVNGNQLTSTDILTNNTNYYASQTIDNCESKGRLEVKAIINTTSAPTGLTSQSFCNEGSISDLTVVGNGIKWYDAAVSGNELSSTTALSNNTNYYASQTIDNCESKERLNVEVTITFIDATITLSGTTFTANTADASYQWIDCLNGNSLIDDEISQSYKATTSGTYAAEISLNSCKATSDCKEVVITGIKDVKQLFYKIYPNPTTGLITVETSDVAKNYTVSDMRGNILMGGIINGNTNINFSHLESGVYLLHVEGKVTMLVKQ